jgi:hypothetical protein
MVARKRFPSRSRAWLTAYSVLGAAVGIDRAPQRRHGGSLPGMLVGVPLALVGYQLGCALFGHKPYQSPPDSMAMELVALGGVVAPVEELTWGRVVEPRLGIPMTAALFAIKHVAIDGKWRRAGGLAIFWVGLAIVRRRSPRVALGLHVAANATGVVVGHLTGRDLF